MATMNADSIELDPKGRPLAHLMDHDEKVTECLILLRAFGDALESLSANPMLSAMVPGLGKK